MKLPPTDSCAECLVPNWWHYFRSWGLAGKKEVIVSLPLEECNHLPSLSFTVLSATCSYHHLVLTNHRSKINETKDNGILLDSDEKYYYYKQLSALSDKMHVK